jgi:thiamine biosynthesis protein ThiS
VKITLNGEPYDLAGPLTVGALLARLEIDARRVAVEHNLVVIKRAAFDTTHLREGDEVEIVNFVGGGSMARRSQRDRASRGGAPRARERELWTASSSRAGRSNRD